MINKVQSNWISTISFLCSVFVVMLHCSFYADFSNSEIVSKTILYFSHGIATVAVPSFFFLSGFLLFNGINSINDLLKKLKKRVYSLIIPYLFWNAIYTICMSLLDILRGEPLSSFTFKNILEGIFLHKYIFNMWFLLVLIFNTFVLSFLVFFLKKISNRIVFAIATAVIILSFTFDFSIYIPGTNAKIFLIQFFAYWILGCSVKEECFVKTFDAIKNFKSGKIITIGSLIILLILSYPTMLTKNSLLSSNFEDILVFLITMSFWVFTIGISDYLTAPKANMGMVIYGGHGLFTSFLTNFLYIYNEQLKSDFISIILYFITVFAIIMIIYFVGKLFKKYIKPIYFLAAGGRQ